MNYVFDLKNLTKMGLCSEIVLDESLITMLDKIINPTEEPMFTPSLIQNQTFTVEFVKQDGSIGSLTGRLVAPNYEGTPKDFEDYTKGLENKDLIPIYTDKGWRSFYKGKVVSFTL